MTFTTLLTILMISLPLLGALISWRLGYERLETRRTIGIAFMLLEALLTSLLFLVGRYTACSEPNCFWAAVGVLSLLVAGLFLVWYGSRFDPELPDAAEKALEISLLMAMCGAWALFVLAANFLMWLAGINLFFFFLMRWLKVRNLRPGILIVRDDHKLDDKPK